MKNYLKNNGQSGFTLLEILIVVVIVGVIASMAILIGTGVFKGTKDKLAQTRLAAIVDAQNRFKIGMGRGRFASVCELTQVETDDGSTLVPENVAKFGEGCAPVAIDGWYVFDDVGGNNPADDPSLRTTFLVQLQSDNSKTVAYCMGSDGILRKPESLASGGRGRTVVCNMNSPAVQP